MDKIREKNMSKIGIMTDVNAGLDYIGYDPKIPTLRSIINFGDEHFVDGIEIKADKFYERLVSDKLIPSTSAPTLGDAMEVLDEFVKEGYTDAIMYSISYQLSSIGQMVETLKDEYSDRIKIHVVDTKTATYIQGYIAVEAKRMADEGKSVEEILEYSNYLISNQSAYFVVDNLMYLVKNGRLSGASGFAGTLFKIKPILTINKEGKIVSLEKVKTHHKAIERALELVCNDIEMAPKAKVLVFHTLRENDAKEIVKHLEEKYPQNCPIELHMITPAVGAHIGCGILGFGCFKLK